MTHSLISHAARGSPFGAAEKAARGGSFCHCRAAWDSGAFPALQPVVISGWLLSCPHELLVFPWPVNAATFEGFLLWLFVATSLLHKLCCCPEQSREERGQQGCVLPFLLVSRAVPSSYGVGYCACAALWFHFLYIQMLGVSLRGASPSKEGAAGGSVLLLSRNLYTVTGFWCCLVLRKYSDEHAQQSKQPLMY